MFITWLDSNSWLLEMAGQRILVDPWLVGDLTFGNQSWLFKGEHPQPRPIPESIDLIVLSQGLEDHAHPPTLKALDKSIPVVGSPNAAKVARDLGFSQVTALAHQETLTWGSESGNGLVIKAVPGSPLGPTLVENGYVIREQGTGLSLFYEPHGFHQPTLKEEAPIDVVITPVLNLALPLIGPIIRGQKAALELAEWLQPQVILPTADAGEVHYQGLLINFLKAIGGAETMRAELEQRGMATQILEPQVGDRLALDLTPRSSLTALR